jgi:glycosyltransferase involved in cell wall biosynthesis
MDTGVAGRSGGNAETAGPLFLCVGIVEPRKNQAFVAEVLEQLAREGLKFRCEFVGRVNPHFGGPIAARLKALAEQHRGVRFHEAASDETLLAMWAEADATLFATRAEGCGLPLLESLWFGVPCVYSDLPVLRENADGGGCLAAALDNREAWLDALRRVITDAAFRKELKTQARNRALPTWRETAETLRRALA